MKVQCSHCEKKYTLPPERVAGRILKIRCRQCSNLFEVDGSQITLTTISNEAQLESGSNQGSDSGVSMQLRTQEFSAIDLPNKPLLGTASASSSAPLSNPSSPSGLDTTQKPAIEVPSSVDINKNQATENQLSVEVSQSAQDWMESVMSDVDRPITREIKLNEITGHRTLPPETRSTNWIWLAAVMLLLGLGYLVTQINGPTRDTPKVLSLKLDVQSDASTLNNASASVDQTTTADLDTEPSDLKPKALEEADVVENKVAQTKAINDKKESTKAQLKELNQVISGLKASEDTTQEDKKLEISGNLESARKQASQHSQAKVKVAKNTKLKKAQPSTKDVQPKARAKKSRTAKKSSAAKKRSAKNATKKSKPTKKRSNTTKRTSSKKNGKGLDRRTISTVMNQNASGLENCYRKTLKKDPSFGEVRTRLKFKVTPQGRVNRSSISLSGVYRKTRLESCIQNTVVRWYFPKAEGETPVRYPLNFKPGF